MENERILSLVTLHDVKGYEEASLGVGRWRHSDKNNGSNNIGHNQTENDQEGLLSAQAIICVPYLVRSRHEPSTSYIQENTQRPKGKIEKLRVQNAEAKSFVDEQVLKCSQSTDDQRTEQDVSSYCSEHFARLTLGGSRRTAGRCTDPRVIR